MLDKNKTNVPEPFVLQKIDDWGVNEDNLSDVKTDNKE